MPSITTINLTVNVYEQDGTVLPGASVVAKLTGPDWYDGNYVSPLEVTDVTDANGQAVLALFPNALGGRGTFYKITCDHPTTGKSIINTRVQLPNADVNLVYIDPNNIIEEEDVVVAAAADAAVSQTAAAASAVAAAASAASVNAANIVHLAGVETITGVKTFSAVAITGGTIDGTTVGALVPAAGTFTTLYSTGALTVDGALNMGGSASPTVLGRASATLADDVATSFTPTKPKGIIVLTSTSQNSADSCIVAYDTSGPSTFLLSNTTGNCRASTGVLAGTTGTDTTITVSAHTDGKIYIENRRSYTITYSHLEFGY